METETLTFSGDELAGATTLATLEAASNMIVEMNGEVEEISFLIEWRGVELEITVKPASE